MSDLAAESILALATEAANDRARLRKGNARLRVVNAKLLEACEEGVKTLKLALATIDGACGIPTERRKPSPVIALMDEAIAAAKEDR